VWKAFGETYRKGKKKEERSHRNVKECAIFGSLLASKAGPPFRKERKDALEHSRKTKGSQKRELKDYSRKRRRARGSKKKKSLDDCGGRGGGKVNGRGRKSVFLN